MGVQFPVPNHAGMGPGPGNVFDRKYLLASLLVDSTTGNPGVVDRITVFFVDDAPVDFGKMPGLVRLNLYTVVGPGDLPLPTDNPDNGPVIPATFTQNFEEGWIEVRISDLAQKGGQPPICIEPGVRYFIGITPVFLIGNEPFGGFHIANVTGVGMESQSAFRETSPMPGDWTFAGDLFGQPPQELFATIELEPVLTILLGDINLDGVVDLLDVAPFVQVLLSGVYQIEADINGDGVVNLLDVSLFLSILTGG